MAKDGLTYKVVGADELRESFAKLTRDLAGASTASTKGPGQKPSPNGDLRRASKGIADLVARVIRIGGGDGGAPQASAVAATARGKSDRYVVVKIGSVAVRFSDHRLSAAGSKSAAGSVSYGANYGPNGGHHEGTVVAGLENRFFGSNFYTVARNDGGYFVEPILERLGPTATERYRKAVYTAARKWGLI